MELLLEPNAKPAAKAYQEALMERCIPVTAFGGQERRYAADAMQKTRIVVPETQATKWQA